MKFVYVDESGNSSSDPYLVFVGLEIDAYKLKKTMRDLRPLFVDLDAAYPENLKELKSSKLVNGKGGWRSVDADKRKELFLRLCSFPCSAAAKVYMYVLDQNNYNTNDKPDWATTKWMTSAISLVSQIQKCNQGTRNNKGLTVLIFDDNKAELPGLCEFLVLSDPDIDMYYEKGRKQEPFYSVIDTAFAIKSDHSELVQISDACAYAIRRRAELECGGQTEAWQGELSFFIQATECFNGRLSFATKTWVTNPHCEAATYIRDMSYPNLNKWLSD